MELELPVLLRPVLAEGEKTVFCKCVCVCVS